MYNVVVDQEVGVGAVKEMLLDQWMVEGGGWDSDGVRKEDVVIGGGI
jgi:hypothetical protein